MRDSNSELAMLRTHWPDAELLGEGERLFALIPNLKVSSEQGTKTVAALLRPWQDGDGYCTRLFFSERFTTKGANWNVFSILGRTWHGCSWNGVPADLTWVEIMANHLAPLQ